jgi:hypothetical protein
MWNSIKNSALILCACWLLSSCSFNMGVRVNKQDEPSLRVVQTNCVAFALPEFEPTPTSPIAEIMKIDSRNKDAQIAVLVKHITELKEHNVRQKNSIVNQYRAYLQSCK